MDETRVAIDGVGRVHDLTDNLLREDPVCGYLGVVVVAPAESIPAGYPCPQCVALRRGPATVVTRQGDGGSGLL